ncbi:MAG: class A beta-lactamase-related serine hydrolase [Rubrivivax sp.]|nr:MAG: class A beta-lactamase-related serine hydrolase [Rubrivivax sp.]
MPGVVKMVRCMPRLSWRTALPQSEASQQKRCGAKDLGSRPAFCARACPQALWMTAPLVRPIVQFVARALVRPASAAMLRSFIHPRSAMRNPQTSVALLLSLLAGMAHAGPPPTPAAMAAYADKLLDEQKLSRDGPGVTVLIARGDQLLYKGARGAASIELGVPMQPDNLLRIGSVTKQFAAAALLKQIDEGRAKFDDPLSQFLPDYPNGSKITLLQLLNHTSGVKSYTGLPGYMLNPIRRDLSTAELIKEFKDQPADFAPGEKWAYNNSGYVLLGAVVEAISGKPWHQSVDESLLKPAQITTIHFEAGDKLFKGLARGYTLNGQREVAPAGLLSMTQPHAAGALVANTEGLWRWNQALHGGKVLSPASYARMTTPEGVAKPYNYGFGISTDRLRDQTVLTHGGGIQGFTSLLDYLPASQTTVVILRNSDGPGFPMNLVSRKLAAFAMGEPFTEPKPVAVPVEQLKRLEGVYTRDDKTTSELRVKEGVLYSKRGGSPAIALIAMGGDRFAIPNSLAEIQFDRSGDGKATAARVFNNGGTDAERLTRSDDLPPEKVLAPLTPAQMRAVVGDYSSPQFAFKIFVDDRGRLLAQAPGQPSFELRAVGTRQFEVPEVGAQLEFSGEESKAASVTLKQGVNTLVMSRK